MKALLFFLGLTVMAGGLVDFDSLWDFKDPRESEKRFRVALQENKLKQNKEWVLELQTQIARALALQKRFDDAAATLDAIEPALNQSGFKKAEVRFLLERGRLLYYQRKEAPARPLFHKAHELALERDLDYWVVDSANMLGIVEKTRELRDGWKLRALEFAESSKDAGARKWLGTLYHDYAWVKFDAGDKPGALELFDKSAAAMATISDDAGSRVSRWCAAKVKRLLGRQHEALRDQLKLEGEYRRLGEKDGFVLEELAEIHLALGEKEKALRYFHDAYLLLAQDGWMVSIQKPRLERLKKLAGLGFREDAPSPRGDSPVN